MAGEIQCDYQTGQTLYALVRDSTGRVWNEATQTFDEYATAGLADYALSMTEQGTASGFYTGDMPGLAAGIYSVVAKRREGGTPAETDSTVSAGSVDWTGSRVQSVGKFVTDGYDTSRVN